MYLRTNLNYRIRNDLSNDMLECLTIEITNPRSKGFLVSTWYRPPSSPIDLFNEFEKVIDKIDAENKELFLLGDLNCDFLPSSITHSTYALKNIFDIYGLKQLITLPTRITSTSHTLIDLCITNSCDKVINSGVLHLGISDHYLVYMTRKAHYDRTGPRTIEIRQFKNFQKGKFLYDLEQMSWKDIDSYSNPNDMWKIWSVEVKLVLLVD